jgi:hypothetical protein
MVREHTTRCTDLGVRDSWTIVLEIKQRESACIAEEVNFADSEETMYKYSFCYMQM